MKKILNVIGKIFIAGFVLWHAFSVGIYAIPRESRDELSIGIRVAILPYVTPYMFSTSQWQLWNLFSPDPLRRVTFYNVQVMSDGQWTDHENIHAKTYSVWRHATRFKLLGNTFDEFDDGTEDLSIHYLQHVCTTSGFADGTPIRMQYSYYVIPKNEHPMPAAWWKQWAPQLETSDGPSTACLSQS
jgi:hypothetical protein